MSMPSEPAATFAGRFSDGKTAGSTACEVRLGERGVAISLSSAAEPLVWPFAALGVATPLTAKSSDVLLTYSYMPGATLFVADRAFVRSVVASAPQLTAASFGWRAARPLMIAAAVIVVVLAVSWAVDFSPARAVARLMPDRVRTTIGEQVIASMVGNRRECREEAGRAALDRLVARLEDASSSSSRFKVRVLDWGLVNAFAVPGEQIVLTRGIITQAKTADEVAGVLAHEMGHGLELHPESSLVRVVGLSAAFELMMGGGGGTFANFGLMLTQLSYTRSAEREADARAVQLLQKAGIAAAGLAGFFERASATEKKLGAPEFNVLRTHPQAKERAEAIAKRPTYPATPATSAEDWRALRAICGAKS
jgi:predicted Zn-dependent protease